nr:mobilization protein [Rhizobium leguminosarum]
MKGATTVPRKTIEERLAQLEAQKKTLQARLNKQERAKDTRRKVLLGALVLHRLEAGRDDFSKNLGDWLRRELPGFLTRDADREVLDDLLKPRAANGSEATS